MKSASRVAFGNRIPTREKGGHVKSEQYANGAPNIFLSTQLDNMLLSQSKFADLPVQVCRRSRQYAKGAPNIFLSTQLDNMLLSQSKFAESLDNMPKVRQTFFYRRN